MAEFLGIGAHAAAWGGSVEPGQRVLIVGAGPIGIAAAGSSPRRAGRRGHGAGYARGPSRIRAPRPIGLDHIVVAGPGADAREARPALTGGDYFDVVFDCNRPVESDATPGFALVASRRRLCARQHRARP